MTQTLAKMELVIGNHDSCKALTRESLIRAKTTEMKIDSLLVDVECCMVCNEMDGSIAAAYRALSVLGIEMPRKYIIAQRRYEAFEGKIHDPEEV
jgi:uncharacterized lipoprotein YajG